MTLEDAAAIVATDPDRPDADSVVAEHLQLKVEWLGERKGVLEMRRMYGGYFKGMRNASKLRALLMEQKEMDGVLEVLLNFREDEPEVQVAVREAVKPARLPKKVAAKLPRPSREAAEV